jgi:hypothetical protein
MVERVDPNALACGTSIGSALGSSRSTWYDGGVGFESNQCVWVLAPHRKQFTEVEWWNALTPTRWIAAQVSEAP